MSKKREIEQSEARHKTMKIVSSLIPGGGPVYETFTAIVQPLHEKRRDDWVKEVTLRLHKLEQEEVINLKELVENEEFITIITRATLLAMQTHIEEKRRAFRNIVLNSSEKINSEDLNFDLINSLMTILERISELHIYMLKILSKVREKCKGKSIDIGDGENDLTASVIFKLDESLKRKRDIVNMCWVDLVNNGLVSQSSLQGMLNIEQGTNPQVTTIGFKLIDLIELEE